MKIVIVGNSLCGAKVIEEIRKVDQESEILLFTEKGLYPYVAEQVIEFITGDINPEDLLYQPKEFYKKNNVTLMNEQPITRINLKTKKIYTQERGQFDFDYLILTQLPDQPDCHIKGIKREGYFVFNKLDTAIAIRENLPFVDSILIESDTLNGLELAYQLLPLKKDLYLISSHDSLISHICSESFSQEIVRYLSEKGFNFIFNNNVEEILGDHEMKAVRLNSGKVVGGDMLIHEYLNANLKIFSDYNGEDQHIKVDSQFLTETAGVYACEQISNKHFFCDQWTTQQLEDQAMVIAHAMVSKDYASKGNYQRLVDLGEYKISCVGNTNAQKVSAIYVSETMKTYKQLFVLNDIIVGGIFINDLEGFDTCKKWVSNQSKTDVIDLNEYVPTDINVQAQEQLIQAK